MELPKSPEDENDVTEGTPMAPAVKWMIALALALLVAMIVLHLTGVVGGSSLHS